MEPLDILYQDEWIVAVDKPAGHLVHPASDPQEDDLVTMKILRDQIGQRVNSIHRLDRPTSGVLLFGIEAQATKTMHKALGEHQFMKEYLAVVDGRVARHWSCAEPIQKSDKDPLREAYTSFENIGEVVKGSTVLSLVRARPQTGRFHQIRRHLVSGGTAIVGDYRYAGIERSDELGTMLGTGNRMLLQAHRLKFIHPYTNEPLLIEAPVLSHIKALFGSVS